MIALFAMPVYTINQLISIKESAPLFDKPAFLVDVKDINQRYVNHHHAHPCGPNLKLTFF